MKATFSLVLLLALCCAAFCKEPPVQKLFTRAACSTAKGNFGWDNCVEGDFLHWVVFCASGSGSHRPREMGQWKPDRYAKVTAAGSRNPQATLYAGPNRPDTDLFNTAEQIYQVEKDGQVRHYAERVSFKEFRAWLASRPEVITADALIAHVMTLRAEKE